MNKSLIIIGGGIAGLATALKIKQLGITPIVLEAGHYDQLVAGEHLGADGNVVLEELGIPKDVFTPHYISCLEVQSVWGRNEVHHNESIFNPYGAGLLLQRPDFDRALSVYAQSIGVEIRTGVRVEKLNRAESGWELSIKGASKTFHCDFLIDTSGRNSKFYANFNTKKEDYDELIGITKRLTKKESPKIENGYLLIESIPEGWWYSVQMGDGTIVATFMTDASIWQQSSEKQDAFWHQQLAKTHYTKERLSGFDSPKTCFTQSARTHRLTDMAGEHWLCVGDAAMAYDPLSSMGIIKGLRMGIKAGEALIRFWNGDQQALEDYDKEHQQQFVDYLEQKTHFYQQETRWNAAPFWYKRSLIPAKIKQFSILPNAKLTIPAHNTGTSEKLAYLGKQLPEVDFPLLISCIKKEEEGGKALQAYLEVKAAPFSKPLLQALESMKRIGLIRASM